MKHRVIKPDEVHVCSHANLVLLNLLYSSLERRDWINARKSFLNEEFAKHGKLVCFYCGRHDLKLKSNRRCQQATVDHLIPKSLGGHASDERNFVVCCNSCNKQKGSTSAADFLSSKYIEAKRRYKFS